MSQQRCTAVSKRSGEHCRRAPTPGRSVCYYHGSKSPRGIASPNLTHGRYSQALPGRLLERYHTALADGVLLELRDEVAVLEARLVEVLGRAEHDEAAWPEARELIQERRRLVESERKRLVEQQQMLSVEQAMTLLAAVADTVRRHVRDRDTLAAISAELGRLVALPPGRTA